MKNFEQIQSLWEKQSLPAPRTDMLHLIEKAERKRRKMTRQQLFSGLILLLTPLGVIWVWFFSGSRFQYGITYASLIILMLVPFIQGIINIYIYIRLHRLKITAVPDMHTSAWKKYYAFRIKLMKVNWPMYFILINAGLLLYSKEIFAPYSSWTQVIALILYVLFMITCHFLLARKVIKNEYRKLEQIISDLSAVENELLDINHADRV